MIGESPKAGLLQVMVDLEACSTAPPACDGFSEGPPEASNNNPLRLIVQVAAPKLLDHLGPDSFEILTQFAPPQAAPVVQLVCAECFERREGGTFGLWIHPEEGNWKDGSYFLLVRLTTKDAILPILVQVKIPGANELPRAAIIDIPTGSQIAGRVATFDGSVSLDPDGVITCYQWTIDSNIDLYDEIIQGVGASGIQRTYPEEMNLSIILRVSDDPLIGAQCDPSQPPIPANQFSPFIAAIPYVIECGNPPPVADAGPDITQSVQSSNLVQLDGTGSFDRETPIASYRWACGNGFPPQPSAASAVVVCRYQAVGVYEAQLTVCDQGTPPVSGNFVCQKCSTDTAVVTIFDPLNP